MKRIRAFSLAAAIGCFLIFATVASSQNAAPSAPAATRKSALSPDNTAAEMREGERLFHLHCGRCHDLPEDLSPREARAVVRQMRVRASLTEKDERALLKFLAP